MLITEIINLYSVEQIIQIAAVVSFGALLQSMVGFGFALFSIPLLLLVGLRLHQAIIITLACQIIQGLVGLYCVRDRAPVRNLWVVMVSGVVFLMIGSILLKKIDLIDISYVRKIVSVIILFTIMGEVFWRSPSRKRLSVFWSILAGATAGLMTGIIGMTGPPVVLWAMAQNWSSQQVRSGIWMIFLSIMVPTLVCLALMYPDSFVISFVISMALIPFVLLFSALGVFVGNKIPRKALRATAFVLLTIIGLSSFVGR